MRAIILEGTRGGGKSTVAQLLRKDIWGSTLLNLTGQKEDGDAGLAKIATYYYGLHRWFETIDGDFTFIFDRTFFSERVYSQLYKSYDFKTHYDRFVEWLSSDFSEIEIYQLAVDDEDILRERLNRGKALLFDQVEESVQESIKQQKMYDKVFNDFVNTYLKPNDVPNVTFKRIDTSNLTPEEIKNIILRK